MTILPENLASQALHKVAPDCIANSFGNQHCESGTIGVESESIDIFPDSLCAVFQNPANITRSLQHLFPRQRPPGLAQVNHLPIVFYGLWHDAGQ